MAGPSIEETRELSNLLVVFETYFSKRLITNFEKKPLKKRKNTNIIIAIMISDILTPETPSFQTSTNKSLNFINISIILSYYRIFNNSSPG